jgi:hypothetical protein
LQTARVETDVVSAVNLIETEEADTSSEEFTQPSPDNDDSAEKDPGGTQPTRGTNPNTPPRLKQSHTESPDTPTDVSSDTRPDTSDSTNDAVDGSAVGDVSEESDTTAD